LMVGTEGNKASPIIVLNIVKGTLAQHNLNDLYTFQVPSCGMFPTT
jgi:hypothetical protein